MAHDPHPGQGGDVVAISRGYDPVAAAPGYELYYLWVLAGEERVMRPYEDPNHAWVAAQAR
jgi:5-deoxy-glucuronate isomerase